MGPEAIAGSFLWNELPQLLKGKDEYFGVYNQSCLCFLFRRGRSVSYSILWFLTSNFPIHLMTSCSIAWPIFSTTCEHVRASFVAIYCLQLHHSRILILKA